MAAPTASCEHDTQSTDTGEMKIPDVPSAVLALRQHQSTFAICTKPDPTLKRDLKPGFLLPYLLDFDALTYGRVRPDN